jgi:hypothetical protein
MPRARNPYVSSDNQIVVFLMNEILDKHIFIPGNIHTIKEKAAVISGLAMENGHIKLAESELRNKFFTPFAKGSDITISRDYGLNIALVLSRIHKNYGFEHLLNEVRQFKQLYEIIGTPVVEADVSTELFKKLYGNRQSLNSLVGSSWWIAERIGDHPVKEGKWGIAIGKISFSLSEGYIVTDTMFKFEKTIRKYQGLASHDGKADYIFIDQLSLDETKRRSNIVLRMADMDYNDQSLMIGHYTYHSKKYMRLLSKTIILLKIFEGTGQTDQLAIGNYLNEDPEEYERIPLAIRSFLYSREKNRMSVPMKIVTNLDDLDALLKKRKGSQLQRTIRDGIRNDYLVYYKKLSGQLVENKLNIDYNQETVVIGCTFEHNADRRFDKGMYWKGSVFYNSIQNVVVLEMSNEKSAKDLIEEDPILLSFILPAEDISFSEVSCYQGIICGLGDTRAGAVSYKCLLVPASVKEFNGLHDPRIQKIFNEEITHLSLRREAGFSLDNFEF